VSWYCDVQTPERTSAGRTAIYVGMKPCRGHSHRSHIIEVDVECCPLPICDLLLSPHNTELMSSLLYRVTCTIAVTLCICMSLARRCGRLAHKLNEVLEVVGVWVLILLQKVQAPHCDGQHTASDVIGITRCNTGHCCMALTAHLCPACSRASCNIILC
jgi:hypothetical protein